MWCTGVASVAPVLSGAEFLVSCEYLGLGTEAVADLLGVKLQSVARWQRGTSWVPPGVEDELARLRRKADEQVERLVAEVHDGRTLILVPAGRAGGFQRAIVARVLRQVDVKVEYAPE